MDEVVCAGCDCQLLLDDITEPFQCERCDDVLCLDCIEQVACAHCRDRLVPAVNAQGLVACPFCGSHSVGVVLDEVWGAQATGWAQCQNCNARGPTSYAALACPETGVPHLAMRKWNERAPRFDITHRDAKENPTNAE